MTELKYKIVIFGKGIYREISLPENGGMMIGTTNRCGVRFDREEFLSDFEIAVSKTDGKWQATCGNSVFFSNNTTLKLASVELETAGKVTVMYRQGFNASVFTMEMIVDFDQRVSRYDRIIVIDSQNQVLIGGRRDCHVFIDDSLLSSDCISLSRQGQQWYVRDNGTRFGVYVNGARRQDFPILLRDGDFLMLSGYSFFFKYNSLYTEASDIIKVNGIKSYDRKETKSALNYPKFVLSSRVKKVYKDNEVEVLAPTAKEKAKKQSLILTLLPTLVMAVATVALRSFMGTGGSFIYYSVGMMAVGALTSLITALSERSGAKKDEKKRNQSYNEYIKEKKELLAEKHSEELQILNENYRSVQDMIDSVYNFDNTLFDRRPDDSDFLDVCLGKGTIDSSTVIKYNEQEKIDAEDELQKLPSEMKEKYSTIDYAPIVLKMREVGAVGAYGPEYQCINLLKQIVIETCVRQYFEDVKLYLFINPTALSEISWIRWFKQIHSDDPKFGAYNIVSNEESKKLQFEQLSNILQERSAAGNSRKTEHLPHYVVLFYDDFGVKNHPLSQYIETAKDYGFTFVFFDRSKELIPKGCSQLIEYNDYERKAKLIPTDDGSEAVEFTYLEVNSVDAEKVARRLSPVYADEINLDSSLVKKITFYEMMGIYSPHDIDLLRNWESHDVCKSMAAPIGVGTDGKPISLDIRQHIHGPHGLVAGYTGYGKSEIVQTYIASMALTYSPTEVGFVFVDFKGGGMANLFKNLPHQVGIVTDIDGSGKEADEQAKARFLERFLESLREESEKRKRLFKTCQNSVNHIDDYIREYRAGRAEVPLQHLILVVDEFAELKRTSKDFITQLVSFAATGRSLGIHLILATQDPGSSVDDEIKINSNFTLCLKMKTAADSRNVIGSPLASAIEEPGRAYMQVGGESGTLTLLQSAYSGASVNNGGINQLKPFKIFRIYNNGEREIIYERTNPKAASGNENEAKRTQLDEIVDYVAETVQANDVSTVSTICLAPLPGRIAFSERFPQETETTSGFFCEIGIYDNPAGQYQGPFAINFTNGNSIIVGSQMTGKSNTLQYIVRETAERYSAQEVTFYLVDNSSAPSLQTVSGFHNVGGMVSKNDDESFKKLIDLLNYEMTEREAKFSSVGCDTFKSYIDNGYTGVPQIVVLIDNIVAMMESREELYIGELGEDILYLLRDGVSMGISFVATTMEISHKIYRFMPYFSHHVALFCNDSSEYVDVVGRTKLQPKNSPGKCVVDINQDVYEGQLYCAFDVTESSNRLKLEEIANAVKATSEKFPHSKARNIPFVPERVTKDILLNDFCRTEMGPYVVPLGVKYSNVTAATVDLEKVSSFFICGAPGDDKGNIFVRHIENWVNDRSREYPVELHVFDNYEMKGKYAKDLPITQQYTFAEGDIIPFMNDLAVKLEYRSELRMNGQLDELKKLPLILAVIHNNDCLMEINNNMAAKELYKALFKKYRGLRACIILADVDNEPIQFNSPEPLKIIKEARIGYAFNSINDVKLLEIDYNAKKIQRKPLGVADCLYFEGSSAIDRIKIATN